MNNSCNKIFDLFDSISQAFLLSALNPFVVWSLEPYVSIEKENDAHTPSHYRCLQSFSVPFEHSY